MVGNMDNLDLETFANLMAATLDIPRQQISGLQVIAQIMARSVDSNVSFVLNAVITYPNVPAANQSVAVLAALNDSSSLVVNYFSAIDLGIVSVDYTVEYTDNSLSTIGIGNIPTHPLSKTFLKKYFWYIVVGVPCVALVGVGCYALALYRHKRSAALRDMQEEMHWGISMVEVA
jgi:hypothetical protein